MTGFTAAVLSLVVFTFLSGWIAARRGRSTTLWYWLGAIFGPIAAVAVLLLPPAGDPTGRPPAGPLGSAHRNGGLWRRMHARAFGEPRSLDIVLTPAA